MKRIFKYPIPVADHSQLDLPRDARILSVTNQREEIVLYALVEDSEYQTETWEIEVCGDNTGPQHQGIMRNFVNAILDGEKLIAPAEEGVHSVELANAMLLSAFLGEEVSLPIDAALYERELQKRIAKSTARKTVRKMKPTEMRGTF